MDRTKLRIRTGDLQRLYSGCTLFFAGAGVLWLLFSVFDGGVTLSEILMTAGVVGAFCSLLAALFFSLPLCGYRDANAEEAGVADMEADTEAERKTGGEADAGASLAARYRRGEIALIFCNALNILFSGMFIFGFYGRSLPLTLLVFLSLLPSAAVIVLSAVCLSGREGVPGAEQKSRGYTLVKFFGSGAWIVFLAFLIVVTFAASMEDSLRFLTFVYGSTREYREELESRPDDPSSRLCLFDMDGEWRLENLGEPYTRSGGILSPVEVRYFGYSCEYCISDAAEGQETLYIDVSRGDARETAEDWQPGWEVSEREIGGVRGFFAVQADEELGWYRFAFDENGWVYEWRCEASELTREEFLVAAERLMSAKEEIVGRA